MGGRLLRGRNLGLLAVVLIAVGAGFAVHFAAPSNWLDRNTVDTHFSLRGSQGAPHDVVVVGIDNQSLRTLPRPPIPRRYHARLIERLHAAGARLIVYDVAFDRPTDELDDEALLEAASKGSPIVFATSLISPWARPRCSAATPTWRAWATAWQPPICPSTAMAYCGTPPRGSAGCPRSRPWSRTSCSAIRPRRRSLKAAGSTSAGRPARSGTCPSPKCSAATSSARRCAARSWS